MARMRSRVLLNLLVLSTLVGSATMSSPHRLVQLSEDYNVHVPPTNLTRASNGSVIHSPLVVYFSINLRNVLGVNEKEQLLSLECTIRMFWRDKRISLAPGAIPEGSDYITFKPEAAKHFWVPDVFVDRAKSLRMPTYLTRPASLRIYSDSTLRYSSRVNFDVACPMDFHRYPVDSQMCEVNLESFGLPSSQLNFRWLSDNQVNPNISLAQFSLDVHLSDSYATEIYDQSYPGVIMRIHLSRQLGYHVVQTYVPSVVFVALAWLSLFISPESVPGNLRMWLVCLRHLSSTYYT